MFPLILTVLNRDYDRGTRIPIEDSKGGTSQGIGDIKGNKTYSLWSNLRL